MRKGQHIEIRVKPGVELVAISDNYALPANFTAVISGVDRDTVTLNIDVINGKATCSEITVTANRLDRCSLQAMPLAEYIREATDTAGHRIAQERPQTRSRDVADIYRRAVAAGHHPTRAVTEHWDVSRSTASRMVRQARTDGLLGPARHMGNR